MSTLKRKVEVLVQRHLSLRPKIKVTDVYKLLYQGVLGVSHLFNDNAKRWLVSEAEGLNLENQFGDSLLEELSVDGFFVRVNLRQYLKKGLDLDRLFTAIKRTSKSEGGGMNRFISVWSTFVRLVRLGRLGFDIEEVKAVHKEVEKEGYPPRHHSVEYKEAYSPSYRVVSREVLKQIFTTEEIIVDN